MNLQEAKVLVTGGSSGIGLATARLLIEAGASVAISGRNREKLDEAATTINATPIQANVSDEKDVGRMIRTVIEELGGYDVLINNAGIGTFSPLVEQTADDFRRIWETNVLGAMLVARESAKHFVSADSGNIVNIGSTAAQKGFAGGSAYVASKFALRGLTECWRSELRKHNVRVIQIDPSEVITEFAERAGYGQDDNPSKLRPEDIGQLIVDVLRMKDRGFVTDATVWATNPK